MTVRSLLAMLLFWLAVLLIVVGGLVALLGVLTVPFSLWLGGGLLALGFNVLVAGDLGAAASGTPFRARAEVSRAVLEVAANLSDVEVRAGDDVERLAAVRMGPGARPDFEVVDGVAHLRLARRWRWLPGLADWRAKLATNVLWDVSAQSVLGHVEVDLRGMWVDHVWLRSGLGGVRVTCPKRGRPVLELESVLGDLEVVVPRGVGARVRLEHGKLANVVVDTAYFDQLDAGTYASQNVETAETVAEITLRNEAGEVRIRPA